MFIIPIVLVNYRALETEKQLSVTNICKFIKTVKRKPLNILDLKINGLGPFSKWLICTLQFAPLHNLTCPMKSRSNEMQTVTLDAYLHSVEYFQSGLWHLDGYVPSFLFLLSTHRCFNYPRLVALLIAYFVNCSPSRSPPVDQCLCNAWRAKAIILFLVTHRNRIVNSQKRNKKPCKIPLLITERRSILSNYSSKFLFHLYKDKNEFPHSATTTRSNWY